MDCAICLNPIASPEEEAFLYPCCHFFCFTCIMTWTERQRQHPPDEECAPQRRCVYTCPLCKAAYSYIAYECIGTSCRLIPTCGQPKTMSAMPLSVEQSHRRALYVTPAQLTPDRQVPTVKRARLPSDKEATAFVQRELQAVLLTDDVSIIAQHIQGLLQALVKNQQKAGAAASKAPVTQPQHSSTVYGDKQAYMQQVTTSLKGFLDDHSEQFAEQLWSFLHSGLSVAAYDRLIFGGGAETADGQAVEPPSTTATGLSLLQQGVVDGEDEGGWGGGLREL